MHIETDHRTSTNPPYPSFPSPGGPGPTITIPNYGFRGSKAPLSLSDFTTISLIGRGSYAKVLLVRRLADGQLYALKILKKKTVFERNQKRHVLAEKEILSALTAAPFFVQFFGSFQNESKLFFVLEYCPGGELFRLIQTKGKLPEGHARFYACQLVLAIGALHKRKVIYRDLKPENVMLDADGYVKIVDFGLSKMIPDGDSTKSICGTPEYFAPEVVRGQGYGKAVDWWTLGCIIFEMVTGLPPFYKDNRQDLFEGIKLENPKLPRNVTPECRQVISSLLTKDPAKRLGSQGDMDEVKDHPWFSGISWSFVLDKRYDAPYKINLGQNNGVQNFDRMFTGADPYSPDMEKLPQFSGFDWTEGMAGSNGFGERSDGSSLRGRILGGPMGPGGSGGQGGLGGLPGQGGPGAALQRSPNGYPPTDQSH